jgi:hypothetical protein
MGKVYKIITEPPVRYLMKDGKMVLQYLATVTTRHPWGELIDCKNVWTDIPIVEETNGQT